MGKIIRRTVTISITEIWTIVWTHLPETEEASDKAEPDSAIAHSHLLADELAGVTETEAAAPAGEPASPPDGDATTDAPSVGKSGRKHKPTYKRRQQARYKNRNMRRKGPGSQNEQTNTRR